jgi:hypothetical protein
VTLPGESQRSIKLSQTSGRKASVWCVSVCVSKAGTYGELRGNHKRSWDIRGTAGESRKAGAYGKLRENQEKLGHTGNCGGIMSEAGTYGELRENHERSWDIRGTAGET